MAGQPALVPSEVQRILLGLLLLLVAAYDQRNSASVLAVDLVKFEVRPGLSFDFRKSRSSKFSRGAYAHTPYRVSLVE